MKAIMYNWLLKSIQIETSRASLKATKECFKKTEECSQSSKTREIMYSWKLKSIQMVTSKILLKNRKACSKTTIECSKILKTKATTEGKTSIWYVAICEIKLSWFDYSYLSLFQMNKTHFDDLYYLFISANPLILLPV